MSSQRFLKRTFAIPVTAAAALCTRAPEAAAQSPEMSTSIQDSQDMYPDEDAAGSDSLKDRFITSLPPAVSHGLDIDVWGWLGDLQTSEDTNYYDIHLSLGITKSFDQRAAITLQGDYINADGDDRLALNQGFLSVLLSETDGTIFTIGKFHSNIGVEGRDFWERRTGTTSLIFGAQPQDIVGAMLTIPFGDHVKVRPLITADFQGGYDFDQPPTGGVKLDYHPNEQWSFGLTGLIGPGFVLFGGEEIDEPYSGGSYGDDPAAAVANWQGPHFLAERDGTLYFIDAKVIWHIRPDLSLAAEYLYGTTKTENGRFGWHGWVLLATFDVTDRIHVFGRFSYIDDPDWLVTGFFQTRREVSVGFGWRLNENIEIRGEYRHDFSNAYDDVDSASIHLTFTY